jgi:hypothetical protein
MPNHQCHQCKDYISVATFAALAGVSRQRLYQFDRKRLPASRVIGGQRFFRRDTAEKWIAARADLKRDRERKTLAALQARVAQTDGGGAS